MRWFLRVIHKLCKDKLAGGPNSRKKRERESSDSKIEFDWKLEQSKVELFRSQNIAYIHWCQINCKMYTFKFNLNFVLLPLQIITLVITLVCARSISGSCSTIIFSL